MSRPQRSTPAGRAYLDLQHLARSSGRSMQALLPMFASERWLARLEASTHRSRFVLKGGVLLAALGNRRTTQDADLLALNTTNDHGAVIGYVNAIATIDLSDVRPLTQPRRPRPPSGKAISTRGSDSRWTAPWPPPESS